MEKKNSFPFPQADDFEKLVTLLNIKEESSLKELASAVKEAIKISTI